VVRARNRRAVDDKRLRPAADLVRLCERLAATVIVTVSITSPVVVPERKIVRAIRRGGDVVNTIHPAVW